MSEQNRERRGFLQKALAAVGVSTLPLGLSGRASGLSRAEEKMGVRAVREYADESKRKRTIRTHAEDVITVLSERGHLSRASISELPVDRLHRTVKSYGESEEGVLVAATVDDGQPTVKIQVKKRVDNREIVLIIEPQVEHSRAVVRELDDEGSEQVLSANGDVSTEGDCTCDTFNDCRDDVCGFDCCCECSKVKVKQSCFDTSCEGCELLDDTCCGTYTCDL